MRPFDQNLIFFFLHDHSTRVRGHSYFLIYSVLNCVNISFGILKTVLTLHFLRCIHGGAAKPLYFVHYMEVLLLYFVRYVHGYMKF